MSEQDGSSQDYTSPPSNQLQCGPTNETQQSTPLPTKPTPTTFQDKPLEEILSQFVPFNTVQSLEQPFQAESERDKTFIHEHAVELMELMLEIWAWNMSRLASTTQTESVRLGEKLKTAINTEKEQGTSDSLALSEPARPSLATFRFCTDFFEGMCRRLQEFIIRMRSAIDALRGI